MQTPMGKPIRNAILWFYEGNVTQGWSVRLIIQNDKNNTIAEASGRFLPAQTPENQEPAIQLETKYNNWRKNYLSWGKEDRWFRKKSRTPEEPSTVKTNSSCIIRECETSATELEEELDIWLMESNLENIRLGLINNAHPIHEFVNLVILTDDDFVRKLPWHRSSFFRRYYRHHNISFCVNNGSYDTPQLTSPTNILVVLGSDEDIDIRSDLEIITRQLDSTACIDYNLDDQGNLQHYSRDEFLRKLREKSWEILFFAGHSYTDEDSEGHIYLHGGEDGDISFGRLKDTLQDYLSQNLKLVIINACDGINQNRRQSKPIETKIMRKPRTNFINLFNRRMILSL